MASLLALFGAIAACSSTTTTQSAAPSAGPPDATEPDASASTPDPEDPANQPPHALGTITLGEGHASGTGGSPRPIVTASFVPDALKARGCRKQLDAACEIVARVKCTAVDSTTGCATAEACVLDEDCKPTCKKIPVCSMDCEEDEICTLDKGGKAQCSKPETFDAGPIAFSGTTSSITLFPPYAYEGDDTGAPFLAGADLKVQAQGAVDAGFEKFEESFKATSFVQTSPALNKIARATVFGTGALPVAWKPGTDAILVTVSGLGGSVTCKAQDADGKFDVPRTAIDAVLGDRSNASGVATLSLSVTRQRKETKKGQKTKGELSSVTVQAEGWLDLVTVSTESTSFQGCAGKQSVCGTGCANVQTDPDNCGACGTACATGETCEGGKCVDPAVACEACVVASQTASCKAAYTACTSDTACQAILTCVDTCTTTACVQTCKTQHSTGVTKVEAYGTCIATECASVCE